MEDAGSSNHNSTESAEESIFLQRMIRSFGAEPVTKGSSGGTSSNKESSNNEARSVDVSRKAIEGL